jgi:hypothetical protein
LFRQGGALLHFLPVKLSGYRLVWLSFQGGSDGFAKILCPVRPLQAMAVRYPHLKFELARIPFPDDEVACIPFLGLVGDGVPWPAIALLTHEVISELNAALAETLEGALLN